MTDLTTILVLLLCAYAVGLAAYVVWLSRAVREMEKQAAWDTFDAERARGLSQRARWANIAIGGVQVALLPVTSRVEAQYMGWVIWGAALALSFLATLRIEWARSKLMTKGHGSG